MRKPESNRRSRRAQPALPVSDQAFHSAALVLQIFCIAFFAGATWDFKDATITLSQGWNKNKALLSGSKSVQKYHLNFQVIPHETDTKLCGLVGTSFDGTGNAGDTLKAAHFCRATFGWPWSRPKQL